MQRIDINSNLDKFRLIDHIFSFSDNLICGEKFFHNNDAYLILESLAQLAAMHVRKKITFSKHAFLLKVNSFEFDHAEKMDGAYQLNCELLGNSSKGYLYSVKAVSEYNKVFKGKLLIGIVEYDSQFKESELKDYYQKVFRCLQTDSEKS